MTVQELRELLENLEAEGKANYKLFYACLDENFNSWEDEIRQFILSNNIEKTVLLG